MSSTSAPKGIQIPLYPCDRGMGNALARGYHEFSANEHGVVCRFCGKRATA